MAQTLDTDLEPTGRRASTATQEADAGAAAPQMEGRLDRFLSELARMTPQERISASRYSFNRTERTIYAARYPEEVPTVNGELEWIALNLE